MSTLVATHTFDLTEREIEILEHLNEGLKNQEIADRTGLTLYTVKWYLKQIYSKLYVSNRTQAATKAREFGLLSEEVKRSTRTMAAIRTNLPETRTPFFGREDELAQLKQLLVNSDDVRLVTLHGIGGMGKTRLALEAAHQLQAMFADGTYFIPLATVTDNPLRALVDELGISGGGDSIKEQLGSYLGDKHILIVLDNFEHLLQYASEISDVLSHTSHTRFLVTSREVLSLRGEYVMPLDGLDDANGNIAIDDSAAYQLYLQRAELNTPDFNPVATEKTFIRKICDLVGGMPLAIEMAAGWSAVMTIEDMHRHVSRSIDLLSSDEHDRPPRHQSIRATFDYSLDLLGAKLQKALVLLGVFHPEGFTLAGAEFVAGLSPHDLKQLMQAALLQRGSKGRFQFHPLIQQYVRELLQADRDLHNDALQKHGEYYLRFSTQLIEKLYEPIRLTIIDDFMNDGGNLMQAWYYAVKRGYYDWLLVATEVGYITEMGGLWKQGHVLYRDTYAAIPEDQTVLRGRLRAIQAIIAARFYQMDKLELYAYESWEHLKDSDYVWDAIAALGFLAPLKALNGDFDGGLDLLDFLEDAKLSAKGDPNQYIQSVNRVVRPATFLFAGKYEAALEIFEAANLQPWSEASIYLPETYLLLGMEDKAYQSLVHLFTGALDIRNHRLSQLTSFHLAILENEADDYPEAIVANFMELIRMGFKHYILARNGHYQGTMFYMRGLDRWANLLWYSMLKFLYDLDEHSLMYRYCYRVGASLLRFVPDKGASILISISQDDDCPKPVRTDARDLLGDISSLPDFTPMEILQTLETVLLGDI